MSIRKFGEQRFSGGGVAATLLVNVGRWIDGDQNQALLPEQPDSDVLHLWHIVHECVGRSQEFVHQIGKVPNYDSVRHRFKNVFGVSPTQLLFRLRMQKATNLLLETPMSIKESLTSWVMSVSMISRKPSGSMLVAALPAGVPNRFREIFRSVPNERNHSPSWLKPGSADDRRLVGSAPPVTWPLRSSTSK